MRPGTGLMPGPWAERLNLYQKDYFLFLRSSVNTATLLAFAALVVTSECCRRHPVDSTSQNTLSPTGLQLGTGVRVVSTERSYTQGNLDQTGNSLDLAIQGRGFFQVLRPDGTIGYTRDGSFQVNAQGQVVNSSGYQLQPGITIPTGAQSITIATDGVVSVQVPGQSAPTTVGTIQLADFINPPGLQTVGDNLLVESASSGAPTTSNPGIAGMGTLVQGSVESSNVDVVQEMVDMIQTQRAYEMNSKAVQATDQMLQFAEQNM
jgi:flagellar basal-body rod protein FlgG